jgi:hypothetical protein
MSCKNPPSSWVRTLCGSPLGFVHWVIKSGKDFSSHFRVCSGLHLVTLDGRIKSDGLDEAMDVIVSGVWQMKTELGFEL